MESCSVYLVALAYGTDIYAPPQICVEQKQIMWLERRIQQLTVSILRVMFKKLYTCLQFGDEKAGLVFLMCDENWLKVFIESRVKLYKLAHWKMQQVTLIAVQIFTVLKIEDLGR